MTRAGSFWRVTAWICLALALLRGGAPPVAADVGASGGVPPPLNEVAKPPARWTAGDSPGQAGAHPGTPISAAEMLDLSARSREDSLGSLRTGEGGVRFNAAFVAVLLIVLVFLVAVNAANENNPDPGIPSLGEKFESVPQRSPASAQN
jgi:hypothetical protein